MGISLPQILLILIIILVVFGAGKLPNVMGDVGKGIKNMKKGLKGDDDSSDDPSEKIQDAEFEEVKPTVKKKPAAKKKSSTKKKPVAKKAAKKKAPTKKKAS